MCRFSWPEGALSSSSCLLDTDLNDFTSRTHNSPRLDSSCIQPHLCQVDEDSPDVLLLYDCCNPANGQGPVESGRAVIELLAACGCESIAPEVGRNSFTHCLIQELSLAASQRKSLSIPELHRRQLCRLQSGEQKNVRLCRDGGGKLRVQRNGDTPIFDMPVRRTPIHCLLSQNDRPRAIVLAPLPPQTGLPEGQHEFIDLNGTAAASQEASRTAEDSGPRLEVLLRISLADDQFNEVEFKEWLCDAPAIAKGIRVLNVLPSCSTLLLLQIPVEVWDMLPPSPAISFIGFVWNNATTFPGGHGKYNPPSGNDGGPGDGIHDDNSWEQSSSSNLMACPFRKRNIWRFNVREHPACVNSFTSLSKVKYVISSYPVASSRLTYIPESISGNITSYH